MKKQDIKFLSVNETAKLMGVCKSLLYKMIHNDDCPFMVVKAGDRYIIPYNSFAAWYDSLAETGEEGGNPA